MSVSVSQTHFIVLIKCYLLSWQVSEAGFPVTGVAHMQWVATSKMLIHEDRGKETKNQSRKKKTKQSNHERIEQKHAKS